MAGLWCPPSHSVTALLSWARGRKHDKRLVGGDQGREVTQQVPSRAKQARLGEIKLFYCQLTRTSDNEKEEQIYKPLPPSPPFFPGSTSLPNSPPPPPERRRGTGNGACGQFIARCLCRSVLLTLLPCSSVGSLPRETVLHQLLQRGSFPGGAVLQEQAAPAWVPHRATSPASKAAPARASHGLCKGRGPRGCAVSTGNAPGKAPEASRGEGPGVTLLD